MSKQAALSKLTRLRKLVFDDDPGNAKGFELIDEIKDEVREIGEDDA